MFDSTPGTPATETNDLEDTIFINTFHTNDREDQEKVVQSLVQVTEDVMRHQPGFISATLQRSFDGKTVTNLARWRSAEDLKKALAKPEMLAHRDEMGNQYKREGYLGQVVYTYTGQVKSASGGLESTDSH